MDQQNIRLIEASKTGNIEAVKSLIKENVDTNYMLSDYDGTALYYAVSYNHIDIVNLLIKAGSNVDFQNYCGYNGLIVALNNGYIDIAKTFILHGANLNHYNKNNENALNIACENGYSEIVRMLIDKNADLNNRGENNLDFYIDNNYHYDDIPNQERYTPLMSAILNNHNDIIEMLINAGADLDAINEYNDDTAIFLAIDSKNLPCILHLLKHNVNVNIHNSSMKTPLIYAFEHKFYDAVEAIINAGADLDMYDRIGYTIFIHAIEENNESIIRLLIEKNVNINIVSKYSNDSPLLIACKEENLQLVQRLIDLGANIELQNDRMINPLLNVVQSGNLNQLSLLIKKNANINVKNNDGMTPLLLSVLYGHNDLVNVLIDAGADLDAQEYDDLYSALMIACNNGNLEIVKKLINAGAKIDLVNKNENNALLCGVLASQRGETAIDPNRIAKSTDFISIFAKEGIDINAKNKDGETALMICMSSIDAITMLIELKADLNIKNKAGLTTLMVAIEDEEFTCADKLIQNGANVNVTSWRGYSPLLFSLQYECNTNVSNKLIQFGANVHHQADDGNNALIIASLRRHVEIVRHLIIDKKVDINVKNNKGVSAFMAAALLGSEARNILKFSDFCPIDFGGFDYIERGDFSHIEIINIMLDTLNLEEDVEYEHIDNRYHKVNNFVKHHQIEELLKHDVVKNHRLMELALLRPIRYLNNLKLQVIANQKKSLPIETVYCEIGKYVT